MAAMFLPKFPEFLATSRVPCLQHRRTLNLDLLTIEAAYDTQTFMRSFHEVYRSTIS